MGEKIEEFWRDATFDDVARAIKGETVEARFRDSLQNPWCQRLSNLAGYDSTESSSWIENTGCSWAFCQVYDEPSLYANKPDPGPGYRLLEKFPDDPKLETDEAWNSPEGKWQRVANDNGIQEDQVWYRRRIEPVEAEPVEPTSDLATAARQYRASVVAFHATRDAVDASRADLINAFAASQKSEVVVRIDGGYYLFGVNAKEILLSKVEVVQ